jgi:hypothetical protein
VELQQEYSYLGLECGRIQELQNRISPHRI